MRIGTLFSGIGAPEQAATRVYGNKFEHVFACEWDKFARQSFNSIYDIDRDHFHKDINDMDGKQYAEKVDCIIGGSPCQDFSIAGLRAGVDGHRGQLIWQYFRIINEARPLVFIYENVKGMVSDKNGNTIKDFLEVFRSIGYYCHWEVLNSKDYGIPQNRERVFIVGFIDHEAYYRFQFAPKQKLEKRLKDVLESEVDEKYYLSETAIKGFQTHAERMAERGNGFKFDPTNGNNIASSITTRAGGRPDDNFINEGVIGMLDIKGNDQIKRVYGTDGSAPCLQTMQCGNREPKIIDDQGRLKKQENPILLDHCPTLRAQSHGNEPKVVEPKICAMRGRNPRNPTSRESGLETVQMIEENENGTSNCLTSVQKDNLVLENQYRIRKLTPLECWRLQDFPDEAHKKAKAAGVSDSQRYKQAGNSITVAVMEMILMQVDKALKGVVDTPDLFSFAS